MPNTFTQIHLHVVFAVKFRIGIIQPQWKDHKLLTINGMPDHVHIFIGMRPTQSLAEHVQDIKSNSSKWINANQLVPGRFEWQEGYGAFSYSKSQVQDVIHYIEHQEAHHAKQTFKEEYEQILNAFGITFDPKYIFQEPA